MGVPPSFTPSIQEAGGWGARCTRLATGGSREVAVIAYLSTDAAQSRDFA